MNRNAALWVLAAIWAGSRGGHQLGTSELTSQHIGLSSEPISAGRSLAPAGASSPSRTTPTRTAGARTRTSTRTITTPATPLPASTTTTPGTSLTESAQPVESVQTGAGQSTGSGGPGTIKGAPPARTRAPAGTTEEPRKKPCQSFTFGWAGAGGPAVRLMETNPKDSSDATSPNQSKDRRARLRTGGRRARSSCTAPCDHADAGRCAPGPGGSGTHAGDSPDGPHRPPRTASARWCRDGAAGCPLRCGQGRRLIGRSHRLERLPRRVAFLQLIVRCAS